MGYYADQQVRNFTGGHWGLPMPKPKPRTEAPSRAAIANENFHVVRVCSLDSVRTYGSKLVVCEAPDPRLYWVWASNKVTVIERRFCEVVEANLVLNQALRAVGRKTYSGADI